MKLTLPDWIKGTSIGAQVAQEAAELEATERDRLAAEIATLERQREVELPELRERFHRSEARAQAARDMLTEARRKEGAAQSASMAAVSRYEHRISALQYQLRATSDPAIAAFIDELDELELGGRRMEPEVAYYGPRKSVSNYDGIAARLDGIRAARRTAQALQLEILTAAQVADRIAEIRDSIPAVPPPEAYFPPLARSWPRPEGED